MAIIGRVPETLQRALLRIAWATEHVPGYCFCTPKLLEVFRLEALFPLSLAVLQYIARGCCGKDPPWFAVSSPHRGDTAQTC